MVVVKQYLLLTSMPYDEAKELIDLLAFAEMKLMAVKPSIVDELMKVVNEVQH